MDRGAWWAAVHLVGCKRVGHNWLTEHINTHKGKYGDRKVLRAQWCLSPKFVCWSPNLRMYLRTWPCLEIDFKEVIKWKRDHLSGSSSHMTGILMRTLDADTDKGRPSEAREKALSANQGKRPGADASLNLWNQPCWYLDLGLQPPELWENKSLLINPLSLWCFVTAALADSYKKLRGGNKTMRVHSGGVTWGKGDWWYHILPSMRSESTSLDFKMRMSMTFQKQVYGILSI